MIECHRSAILASLQKYWCYRNHHSTASWVQPCSFKMSSIAAVLVQWRQIDAGDFAVEQVAVVRFDVYAQLACVAAGRLPVDGGGNHKFRPAVGRERFSYVIGNGVGCPLAEPRQECTRQFSESEWPRSESFRIRQSQLEA